MKEIFKKRQKLDFHLRCQADFLHLGVNTSYFGLKSLIYFSSKIWNIIPDEIKNYLRSEELKIKIRQRALSNCHCKLCRTYTTRRTQDTLA